MRKRSSTAFVAIVFALLAGAALAQSTFRIAIGVDPDSLDPAQGTTTTVDNVLDYMVQPLVTIDSTGKLVPDLATSWSTSADGKTLTFVLRQGVTFQDGTPFDASAVKWNLERLLDPKVRVPRRGQLTVIDSVDVVDAHTVRLNLKEPSPALVGALSQTTVGMLSPASVDKDGNSYQNIVHPVGTGAYTYTSRQKGSNVVVTRYAGYWGEKPYYDKVVFQVVPEATTRESLLLAGQVDLIILPPTSDLPALQHNSRVKVLFGPSDRTVFIAINTTKKVLDNKLVREALNYAVDKQAIIKGVLFGAAEPMDAPMAPSLFGYKKIGAYPYDPEKAKQLLKQAGVDPSQITLHMISPTGRYVQDFPAAQAIANYIRDIGFKVDVRTMDWPTYVGTITKPQGREHHRAPPAGLGALVHGRLAADAAVRLHPEPAQRPGDLVLLQPGRPEAAGPGEQRDRRAEARAALPAGLPDHLGRRALDLPVGAALPDGVPGQPDRHLGPAQREVLRPLRAPRELGEEPWASGPAAFMSGSSATCCSVSSG